MLRYRALLVDTEGVYERPLQTFCNDLRQLDDWAKATLARAVGKDAYVVVYREVETELGSIKKSDFHDKGATERVQSISEAAGKPPA